MIYWIWLRDEQGEPFIFQDGFLPGIIPQHHIEHTAAAFVERLGVCDSCRGDLPHVIEEETGRKFCPILFNDLVRPRWKVQDLLQ